MRLEGGCSLFVTVGCEIVEDDCRAGSNFRDQHFPDIGRESGTVHGPLDHPRSDQAVTGQPGNQGLVVRFRHLHPISDSIQANVGIKRTTSNIMIIVDFVILTFDLELSASGNQMLKSIH